MYYDAYKRIGYQKSFFFFIIIHALAVGTSNGNVFSREDQEEKTLWYV